MATDDVESPVGEGPEGDRAGERADDDAERAVVGEYTWIEYLREHGRGDAANRLEERRREAARDAAEGDDGPEEGGMPPITGGDLRAVGVDPETFLGFDPDDLPGRLAWGAAVANGVESLSPLIGYDETPVIKDIYGWEDYKREYFYDEHGEPPTDAEGEPEELDQTEALGFDPDAMEETLSHLSDRAEELEEVIDERTVDVDPDLDEDAFFSDAEGTTTVVNRYDLEKAVPMPKKTHFQEVERYWVNEPYAFVIVFHSRKENEKKYYLVEPYLNPIEDDLTEYLEGKLRSAIKYADEGSVAADEEHRREVIREETYDLLDRYGLYEREGGGALGNVVADALGLDPDSGLSGRLVRALGYETPGTGPGLEGITARPEPAVVAEDPKTLTEYTVRKLLYYLQRDFIGYERIDGIKHDINVEDISCDGYDSPVFVYHSDYEQIISNVYHGHEELDDFVVKLAQRSGKGISKRRPQVDATLPDGSRAQLTLGREVSDHGTNYTIRQFKDVPFTPIDLVNWHTFSLEEMAFLWLCIENDKSLIFAGGTASGKTTSLNAVSLFIPSNAKIVSIEDTREVELPQRNWIASVTRPSFSEDDKGDVDEFDLLEAALRQRPDYIVMGEVRGEEGRTLFQVMSTGHTTSTTFHADSVGEVLKRFTTDPINVSKTMFTALDLVSIQSATRVEGRKVRRNKSITEINHYDAENDEINVRDIYQWQAEGDEFVNMGASNTVEEIAFDRGWSRETLEEELLKRQAVLAYLIDRGLNTYTQVAATLQAYINDPETILALMATDRLEASLEDLREMESVLIDVDPEAEEMVPRPDADERVSAVADDVLERAEDLLERHRGRATEGLAEVLADVAAEADEGDVAAEPGAGEDLRREATGDADPAGEAAATGEESSPADRRPGNDVVGASDWDTSTAWGDAGASASGGFDPNDRDETVEDLFASIEQFSDRDPEPGQGAADGGTTTDAGRHDDSPDDAGGVDPGAREDGPDDGVDPDAVGDDGGPAGNGESRDDAAASGEESNEGGREEGERRDGEPDRDDGEVEEDGEIDEWGFGDVDRPGEDE